MAHAHVGRGRSWGELQRQDAAIKEFTLAIRINPEFDLAYFHRAVAWEASGEVEQALDDYTNAIRLNPENDEARVRANQARNSD